MFRYLFAIAAIVVSFAGGAAVSQQVTLPFLVFTEGAPNHGFVLRSRTLQDLSFPVPTFQPSAPNKPIALDLQPSGDNPVESPGNGFTWIDVCDANVMHVNDRPIKCAGMMMTSTGATFAARSFNGAAFGNVFFRTSNVDRWGINYAGHLYPVADSAYQIGSAANRVTKIYIESGEVGALIAALEARIAALEAN